MSAYRKEGATVDDMGLLRTTIEVENLDRRGPARSLPDTLVDTGSEYTWIPRDVLKGLRIIVERKQGFVVADGRRIDRDIGYALIRAGGSRDYGRCGVGPPRGQPRESHHVLPCHPASSRSRSTSFTIAHVSRSQ